MINPTANSYKLIKEGKFQKALLYCREKYEKNRNSIERLRDYVEVLFYCELYPQAEETLDNCLFNKKNNHTLLFLYNDLYTRTGRIDKIKGFHGYSNMQPSIIKEITSIQSEDIRPDRKYFKNQLEELLRFLAINYPSNGKIFKKSFTRIKGNYIDDGFFILKEFALTTNDKPLGYFIIAEIALLDNKFDLAKERFEKLLGKFEPKWLIYNRLGDIALAVNDEDGAEEHYKRAIKLNPNDMDTNLDLIRTFVLKEDYNEAKKQYNIASKKFGDNKVKHLRKYLNQTKKIKKDDVDIVNGLAYFERGGDILPIEFTKNQKGKGKVIPTGHLGYLMLDSIQIAKNIYQRSEFYQDDIDININLPKAMIYKDGPSAGLTFIVGIISQYMYKPIPADIAFTGELTLRGDILKIGGLKEKLTAAYLRGVQRVYIPKRNFSDLSDIPKNVKTSLEIHLVHHFKDAVEDIWQN